MNVRALTPHLAPIAAFFLGAAASRSLAQNPRPFLDPICGLPALQLPTAQDAGWFQLQAADALSPDAPWETILEVNPGPDPTLWHDTHAHRTSKRFFRSQSLPVRPPLAPVDNFRLVDQSGIGRELFRNRDAKAFVLVFADNPGIESSWPLLQSLRARFANQPALFWYINPHNTRAEIAATAARLNIDIPVLHDPASTVAQAYHCRSTLEAVVVDVSQLTAAYRGSLREICDTTPTPVVQNYLQDALDAVFARKSPRIQLAQSSATPASPPSWPSLSYAEDIAPILQQKCIRCHRPGDIGSWIMKDHATIQEFAPLIREEVLVGNMPPWHADPSSPRLENDFSLTPVELSKLIAWLDAGAPRGNGPDPLAANPPAPAEEWPLGNPTERVAIPEQFVPPAGVVDYKYVLLENPFTSDTWLDAVVIKPGNREVVHHALLLALTQSEVLKILQAVQSGNVDLRRVGESLGLGGYFGAYVPGMDQTRFPQGTAKKITPGHILLLQMHYTTNGKESSDRTEVGFYRAPNDPQQELKTVAAYSTAISIPPGAKEYQLAAESKPLAKASWIHEVSPHMHYRGSRMRFEAIYPDGSREDLLNIPAYQFDWQTLYRLSSPKLVPAGTRIRCSGAFDNSRWNPKNPDYKATVTFGEQSWEEMFIGYLNVAEARP